VDLSIYLFPPLPFLIRIISAPAPIKHRPQVKTRTEAYGWRQACGNVGTLWSTELVNTRDVKK